MDEYNIHGLGMDNLIPVTVYADDSGLYTEEECEEENITLVMLPACLVETWFNTKIKPEKNPCHADYDFDNWYYEWYDADDTVGLCDFVRQYGIEVERVDGLKRADVELAEKFVRVMCDTYAWWDTTNTYEIATALSKPESCKRLINEMLDGMATANAGGWYLN